MRFVPAEGPPLRHGRKETYRRSGRSVERYSRGRGRGARAHEAELDYDREPIDDTREPPYSAICALDMAGGGAGTGWLVGDNLVLTAGHNILTRSGHRYPWVRVRPGVDNDMPLEVDGVILEETVSDIDRLLVSPEWNDFRNPELDWGVIVLNENFGELAGSLAMQAWTTQELLDAPEMEISGYPDHRNYEQWFDIGHLTGVGDRILQYRIDTSGGQSGSPIMIADDSVASPQGRTVVVGIHNYGDSGYNQGTRVTPSIIDAVNYLLDNH